MVVMSGNAQPHMWPQPEGRDARKHLRKRSLLPATLTTERGSVDCRVLDLSAGGAKVECTDALAEGEMLTVMIEAIGTFSGRVVWRRDRYAGVTFEVGAETMPKATVSTLTPLLANPVAPPLVADADIGSRDEPEATASTDFAVLATSDPTETVTGADTVATTAVGTDAPPAVETPTCVAAKTKHRGSRALKLKPRGDDVFTLLAGQLLFQEGDPGGRMYVVRTGRLRIHGDTPSELEEIGTGAVVGELEMLEKDMNRRTTVVAITDCELLEINARRFRLLIGERPDFALEVMHALSGRLRHMGDLRIADGASASSQDHGTDRGIAQ
jgi:CRP/FNR family transcriptional regulator, cyclic AMP receptor protein